MEKNVSYSFEESAVLSNKYDITSTNGTRNLPIMIRKCFDVENI